MENYGTLMVSLLPPPPYNCYAYGTWDFTSIPTEKTILHIHMQRANLGTTIYLLHGEEKITVYEAPQRGVISIICTSTKRLEPYIHRHELLGALRYLIQEAVRLMDVAEKIKIVIFGESQIWPALDGLTTALREGFIGKMRHMEIVVAQLLKDASAEEFRLNAVRDSYIHREYTLWILPADKLKILSNPFSGYNIGALPTAQGLQRKRLVGLRITLPTAHHHNDKAVIKAQRESLLDILKWAKQDLRHLELPLYLKESIDDIFLKSTIGMEMPWLKTLTITDSRGEDFGTGEMFNWVVWQHNVRVVDSRLYELLKQVARQFSRVGRRGPVFSIRVAESLTYDPFRPL